MTRPGRPTKQQEIEAYLQGLDLDPEVIEAIRASDARVQVVPPGAPGSFGEMRDLAAAQLWEYFKTAKGVAKVQAFKAIDEMARRESDDSAGDKEPEPFVADVVAGVASLSPLRKRQILTAEQAKLQVELAAIERVLAEMDAAPDGGRG